MRKLNKLVLLSLIIVLVAMVFVACDIFKGPQDGNKDGVTFTITFDTQGGSEVKPITIAEGATITLPSNPTKEGYIFDGWYLSDEFIEKFNATQTISSDITVYAKWKEEHRGELEFSLNDDETGYVVVGIGDCTDNNIIIPSEYNSKPVIGIGEYAFYECTGLTSITIPDSVTSIGSSAFHECTGLTSITIGSGVTSIGDYAFSRCYKLIEVYNKSSLDITAGSSNNGEVAAYAKNVYKAEGGSKLSTDDNGYVIYTDGNEKILVGYIGSEKQLILPSDITKIYNYAFYKDFINTLTSITIPRSVTEIGDLAFAGCGGLIEVYNKSSLNITAGSSDNGYVAYYAKNVYSTDGDSKLSTDDNGYVIYTDGTEKILASYIGTETELVLPSDITQINNAAFAMCDNITSVSITNGLTAIGMAAFILCTRLNSINIPDTVTSIGDWAFSGCTGLTEIVIPDNVTSIDYCVFSECSGLTSIVIPDSVTSIGDWAFSGCTGLTSVTIPDSVTSIGEYAFAGCTGLTIVNWNATACTEASDIFRGCTNLTTVNIGDNVTTIPSFTFNGCTGLTSITIGSGVTSISWGAFRGCTGLTNIIIPNTVTSIGGSAFADCTGLTSVTIGNGVTSIGSSAFNGCTGLTSIVIPDKVTSIGSYAFYGCSELASIVIPDSVTSIGSYAFYGCSELASIVIPDSVTSIGDWAFSGCVGLTSVYYTGDVAGWCGISGLGNLMDGSRTLYIDGKKVEGELIIPDSVTRIRYSAFYGCTGLTSITIPDSVTSIGSYAFEGCTGLTTVNWNATACTEASYIFRDCTNITTVNIGDNVTIIPSSAFEGCTGLTSIVIPDKVTSIGDWTFYGCTGLASIVIPDSVTSIGDWAFSGCVGLTSVYYIGDVAGWCGISGLDNLMRYGSSPKTLYIGENKVEGELIISDSVKTIPSSAFRGCTGLTSVTIGSGVTSIDRYAFSGCTGLMSIKFEGTIKQWNAISKDSGWKYNVPTSCKIICSDGTIDI